jgi:hypothetical protein
MFEVVGMIIVSIIGMFLSVIGLGMMFYIPQVIGYKLLEIIFSLFITAIGLLIIKSVFDNISIVML